MNTNTNLLNMCNGIAEELKKVYNGELFPEEEERDYLGKEEGEPYTMWEYFNDAYDSIYNMDYMITCNGEYKGVQLMVACGGPNIYIDTISGYVEGYWWGDRASAWIPREVLEEVDNVWEEYFECTIGASLNRG